MRVCEGCSELFCPWCGEHSGEVRGCREDALPYRVDGEVRFFEPVRYGSPREGWMEAGVSAPVSCHDCGCEHGRVHHDGCDVQVCPVCGGQFIGCDCALLQPDSLQPFDAAGAA